MNSIVILIVLCVFTSASARNKPQPEEQSEWGPPQHHSKPETEPQPQEESEWAPPQHQWKPEREPICAKRKLDIFQVKKYDYFLSFFSYSTKGKNNR